MTNEVDTSDDAGGGAQRVPVARVLVADDEESMGYFLRRGLARRGFEVEVVEDGDAALARWEGGAFDVAVVDLKMPGKDGQEVLAGVRRRDPDSIVVMMTGHGTIQSAVQAMKAGAFDYVTKPFELDELVLVIERAMAHRAAVQENRDLRRMVDTRRSHAGLVGQSDAIRGVFQKIDLLHASDATVLIIGESGTGKELVARAIHAGSARAAGPFVGLHCAALPDNLIENELFGHEPGAFTGATDKKLGLIGRADGGTLFLDEVAEISLPVQSKLERFLQEREFVPLGGSTARKVDLRVLASTNRDLEPEVAAGRFRSELFFRLNVVPLLLPPLRERRDDVPALVNHYLGRLAERHGTPVKAVAVDAMILLSSHEWAGNVRELQNVVERLVVMTGERTTVEVSDLPDDLRRDAEARRATIERVGDATWQEAVEAFERDYLTRLFARTHGNVSEAARLAAVSRGHLHRRIKHLDVKPR